MKNRTRMFAGVAALAVLAGCATPPMGPTVQVMPGPNKPFDVFQSDQYACEGYAQNVVQPAVDQANNQMVGTMVIGTLLGAAIGGAAGGGQGAAIGAGAGAAVGTGVGANNAQWSQLSIQQRYNIAYSQCMYSRGDQVPGYRQMYALPPPPPPGSPPPR